MFAKPYRVTALFKGFHDLRKKKIQKFPTSKLVNNWLLKRIGSHPPFRLEKVNEKSCIYNRAKQSLSDPSQAADLPIPGHRTHPLCMRQCEIIALGWYWVTMIFLGQINPKIHCSPGMHNVQVITKYLSYKSVKASWKWTIFGSFMVQFLLITCFCSHISLKNKLHAHTLHTFLTLSAF